MRTYYAWASSRRRRVSQKAAAVDLDGTAGVAHDVAAAASILPAGHRVPSSVRRVLIGDRPVGARLLVDASIGYRLRGLGGVLEGLAIEGSVTNLTDKRYIATIGSNGYVASGDNQTLLAGAPRQWFVTLRRGF